MEGFDEKFRAERADPDDLDRIEDTIASLEAWLVESVDARTHSPVAKLPAKLCCETPLSCRHTEGVAADRRDWAAR